MLHHATNVVHVVHVVHAHKLNESRFQLTYLPALRGELIYLSLPRPLL